MKVLFLYMFEHLEPLGIMYLSAFLKKHNHDCNFLDIKFEKNLNQEIKKISPDIIAYSVTTGKHRFYQKLNKKLKSELQFFSFFGGPHTTFFPDFIYEEGVDAICRGEGEYPLLELANNLKGGDITKIQNVWVKWEGKIYKNEVRPLIGDLDELPFPDREIISKYKHYSMMRTRSVMTSRCCPYNCTYCFNHAYKSLYKDKGKVIRRRSVDNVMRELKLIKKNYFPDRFTFVDDIFIIDQGWISNFCKSYKKDINLPFDVMIRANLVNEEIIKALKYAGCNLVRYGIESGNSHLRNTIIKRNMSNEQILKASRLLNKYGIRSICFNIVGFPEETLKMAFETLELNIKCKPSYSWVAIFQPFPGTDLYKYSEEKGYFKGNINLLTNLDYFGKSVIKLEHIRDIERLRFLFSWGVAFPILAPFIKVLIKLPLNSVYKYLWLLHRSWNYVIKFRLVSISELVIKE